MILTTSRGKEFDVQWAFGPLRGKNELMIEMKDERPISLIAADFEECENIRVQKGERDGEPVTLYEGYTKLVSVTPGTEEGVIRLTIRKP